MSWTARMFATRAPATRVGRKSRRVNLIVAAVVTAMALSLAPPAAAQASEVTPQQDGCTFDVHTPYTWRDEGGVLVEGDATWTCRNASGINNHIVVELYRDGSLYSSAEYDRYGEFTVTFPVIVRCSGPIAVYSFYTRSFGWDGTNPTSYPPKASPSVWLWCP